jgi:hypothetical protein
MAEFEKSLIGDGVANGHRPRYIQIPTAAGQESAERIEYWKNTNNDYYTFVQIVA